MSIAARFVSCDCEDCRNDLLDACRYSGLPTPTDEVVVVPPYWINRACHHGRQGIVLQAIEPPREDGMHDEVSMRAKDEEEEIEAPDWWNNLDASKGIGYVVREQGRYGSYPAHDGFDDESEP